MMSSLLYPLFILTVEMIIFQLIYYQGSLYYKRIVYRLYESILVNSLSIFDYPAIIVNGISFMKVTPGAHQCYHSRCNRV